MGENWEELAFQEKNREELALIPPFKGGVINSNPPVYLSDRAHTLQFCSTGEYSETLEYEVQRPLGVRGNL